VALGAWMALYLLVFSNPAHLAARAGMPLERASWFVLGGWLIGLLVVGLLPLHAASRWRTAEASALAAAGTWVAVFGGDDAWFGFVVGLPGMAVLMFDLLSGRPTAERQGIGAGAAGMVPLSVLYLTYGRFDQPFGPSERITYLVVTSLLIGASLATAWRARHQPPPPFWRAWLGGLLVAAVLALAAARLLTPPELAPVADTAGPIRVMTYNLHQGFDVEGRLGPEALAEVIEREKPDILALQEVARGWLVTGGLDLHAWMTRRLGLTGSFAGTADPQWGNAILTRLPMRKSVYHPLPPGDLPLRRGVLDVTVQTRRGTLRVLCVHLHHRRPDDEIRVRQVEALLDIWAGSPGTLMLGDFNALPGSAAIELLRAAGLRDASELLPPSGRGTTTRLDGRQIDWIFATRDLAFEATTIPYSKASDHLPVMTTVHLTTRLRGAGSTTGAADSRRPPG
jgi:endonuclease/exonuclease/phosphatase family metal-dependent hydrolase